MKFKSKQDVCAWVNKKVMGKIAPKISLRDSYKKLNFVDWVYSEVLRPQKVKVPIYSSKWKIKFLKKLQRLFYSQEEEMKIEGWSSNIDFSKVIWADKWKTYPFLHKVALPKFTKEYELYWTISLQYEFFQENLSFGVRPISVYRYTVDFGGGRLIFVNKSDGSLYQLGGSQLIFIDYTKDFEKHLTSEKTDLDWEAFKLK